MADQISEYGAGSVYQRANGRWEAVVELPRARGERRRRTFCGPDRETAELKLAAYRAEHPATEFVGRRTYMEQARALGRHTPDEWWAHVRSVGGRCAYCGKATTIFDLTQDHRTPVSRGGSDALENLAVACWPCNMHKGTMTAEEYEAWKARRG